MLKQSGPANRVKCAVAGRNSRRVSIAIVPAVFLALTACGSVWHHANKSALNAAADERACARYAEETVLVRTGTPRTEYSARSVQPPASLNRGESPMELHERSQTTMAYNREFESCMRAKGYSKD